MLVTLGDYKTALGLDLTSNTEDTKITQYALEVEKKVQNYIGREIELVTEITELYDGNGGHYLMPRQWPVFEEDTAILLEIYDGTTAGVESWDTWVLGTDYDRLFYRDGYIYIDGATFPDGVNNIRLTYDAGYEYTPDDIQNVCKKLMKITYMKIDHNLLGVSSKSDSVGSSSANTYELDEMKILKEIESYRDLRL